MNQGQAIPRISAPDLQEMSNALEVMADAQRNLVHSNGRNTLDMAASLAKIIRQGIRLSVILNRYEYITDFVDRMTGGRESIDITE